MSHNLCIGHVNVFHIESKLHDVYTLLKNHGLHLLGITETRLSSSKHPSDLLHIPRYSFIRKDATISGHTGIGVYINNNIINNVTRRCDLESDVIESIWIEVRCVDSVPALFGFIYRNPASPISWNNDFIDMMDKVNNCNLSTFILGDFNINLLVPQPSWENITTMLGFKQLLAEPTRITKMSSTLLDHIYTNNLKINLETSTSDICMSDHKPILCKWSFKVPKTSNIKGHSYITYRNFRKFNYNDFLNELRSVDFNSIFSCSEPNQATNIFISNFLPVVNKHAPICKKRVKHILIPNWMTCEIRDAMKVRDQLKKCKRFDEYKHQRNKVTELIRRAKRNYFERLLNQPNSTSTSQVWKAMNEFTNKSRKSPDTITNKFSTDEFNNHFLSIPESIIDSSNPKSAESYVPSEKLKQFCKEKISSDIEFTIPLLSTEKVYSIISKLDNKKSMDVHYLNSSIIKMSLPYILEVLTFIYNLCIQHNTFPSLFKQARVIPLPKCSDVTNLDNYRPISIISVISKPLEKHIHEHLTKYLESNDLFHKYQSGFRTGHSCHTALTRLHDTWLNALNNKNMVGAVFLDMRKAFDLVNHEILLEKLKLYLKNDSTISFLSSYLSNRHQTVYSNGSFSSLKTVSYGVPQGSVLGPTLFCLYINDLPLSLSQSDAVLDLFADDSTLHTINKDVSFIQNSLQISLNDVQLWCKKNKMALHPKKTKSMLIATRQKHQLYPLSLDLYLNSSAIQQVDDHRILGVIFDETLSWHSHINNMCKTISRNLFLMNKLKHLVSMKALKLFFHAHILSHFNYSSNLWSNASQVYLKRLESLHKRGAKLLLSEASLSTTDKYKALYLLPFKDQMLYNGCVLMHKIHNGKSPSYLLTLFTRARIGSRANLYILPLPRIDLFKSSMSFWGAHIWNNLSSSIKNCSSLFSFKIQLKSHLFSNLSSLS